MSTSLVNYNNAVEPDTGDVNPTASSQVAGGIDSISKALDMHDHTAGKGLPVPFSGILGDAPLDANNNPITKLSFLTFQPLAAGSAPNRSLFVDSADELLKFRDSTGTLRVIDTTP